MRLKSFIIVLVLFLPVWVNRATGTNDFVYTDSLLYHAYLTRDMNVWKAYIDASNWATLSNKERIRLLHYEYGFVATQVNEIPGNTQSKRKELKREPKHYLTQYKQHIEALKPILPASRYATYMSAANAYEFMIDKSKLFSSGLKAFELSKEAVEHDPNDPIALILKANMDFYAPRAFGGNKQRALNTFLKAEQLIRKANQTKFNWSYTAISLCIAQCYEKTGDITQAITESKKILKNNPDFEFVRDEYLPMLLKKQAEEQKKNK